MFDHVPFWWVVASREITMVVRRRSFQLSVLFIILGIFGGAFLSNFLTNRAVSHDVATVGENSQRQVELASEQLALRAPGSHVRIHNAPNREVAEELVRNGTVDAALVPGTDGPVLLGNHDVPLVLRSAVTAVVADDAIERNAEALGVQVGDIMSGTKVTTQMLAPGADASVGRIVLAFAMGMLFYGTAVMFGVTIAQSVVAERESRVVEILAAAVPLPALLWGKVFGHTVLALGQMLLTVGVGLLALRFTGAGDLAGVAREVSGWYLVFFLLGFVALSGLWAIAGSLASRQEDLQSTTMPANLLLMIPLVLAVGGGATTKTVASMVPIASALVMPARLAGGAVPEWQLWVALLSNVLAIVVTVRLAAKVYEHSLTRPGRRLRLRDALGQAVQA